MTNLYFLGLFICLLNRSDAIRCFECQNVPFPRDCTKVTECSADEWGSLFTQHAGVTSLRPEKYLQVREITAQEIDEKNYYFYCFTEQVVTSRGNFIFNSGCLQNSRCSPTGISLIGKRSANSQRSTDITTCIECCKNDFCNKVGCGTSDLTLAQRGPYCFNCDAVVDAKACRNITVCGTNELCMLYSPVQYDALPQTIYRGQCETHSACDVISKVSSNQKCAPLCCKNDFCNDHCGIPSLTTAHPQTPFQVTLTSERLTSRTTHAKQTSGATGRPTKPSSHGHFHCDRRGHYIHLWSAHAHLCVHIVHSHANWDDARHACWREGGDLVVLDTYEKAWLMRRHLAASAGNSFWIGARDFNQNNHFLWISHHQVDPSKADWGHGQPDHVHYGVHQDCVAMAESTYMWHDAGCTNDRYYYICEQR